MFSFVRGNARLEKRLSCDNRSIIVSDAPKISSRFIIMTATPVMNNFHRKRHVPVYIM